VLFRSTNNRSLHLN